MSGYTNQIAIGPEFFAKARRDYSNPWWAFVREIMQNCLDAPQSAYVNVRVEYNEETRQTIVSVSNDGEPMDRETILDKLLALGGSTKDGSGTTVGGFGKAKEILYFANVRYEILSGFWAVTGSGAGYDLHDLAEPFPGTISTIVFEGNEVDRLLANFRLFVELAWWPGTIEVNGEKHYAVLESGQKRREFPWGTVCLQPKLVKKLVVRIGGIPMFVREIASDHGLVVNLKGSSVERLTSNRDSMLYSAQRDLDAFITELTVDCKSALKAENPEYERIAGEKLGYDVPTPEPTLDQVTAILVEVARHRPAALVPHEPGDRGTAAVEEARPDVEAPPMPEPESVLRHEFIVKNNTRARVPSRFRPSSPRFQRSLVGLVGMWADALLALYEIHGITDRFSVGFVFDPEHAAEAEMGKFGRVYYLNPTTPGDPKFRLRYGARDRATIIAMAAHEFVHGAMNVSWHDEKFASLLTAVMAKVVQHHRRFNRRLGGK